MRRLGLTEGRRLQEAATGEEVYSRFVNANGGDTAVYNGFKIKARDSFKYSSSMSVLTVQDTSGRWCKVKTNDRGEIYISVENVEVKGNPVIIRQKDLVAFTRDYKFAQRKLEEAQEVIDSYLR